MKIEKILKAIMKRRMTKLYFFIACVLVFAAHADAQVKYSLGAGDEIRLTVYGQPELTAEMQVNSDGAISAPLIGKVPVAGRSSAELTTLLIDLYERGNFLKKPLINIFITRYASQSVSILGKVNRPGKLILEGPTSLTQALAWAGGVADAGNEHLLLIRTSTKGTQERLEFDLQKLLNQEAEQNSIIWLRDGDTIYVPVSGRFYLSGEVHAPGMYPLDRALTVMQAIGVGGGLNARASERSVKLFRKQADGTTKEMRAKSEDLVKDGDIIVIQESLF